MFRQNAGSNMCGPKTSKVPTSILFTNVHRCTYLSRSLFVTPSTVDRRQQTQAFLDSALHMRRRSNKEKKDYFDAAVQSFITSYVVHDPDNEDVLPDQLPCSDGAPDGVRYSMFKHLSTIVRTRISYVILCALSSLELIASLTSNVFAKYMQH